MMRVGTRIAGRWIVEEELPGAGDLRRFRVRDSSAATPDVFAEAVAPAAHVLFRPGVREAFLTLSLADHPAALPTLATDLVDGLPVRVRPATRGTLEAVRRSSAEAVALAGWLAPAILASAGAGGGELGDDDLVVDATGVVRLAPSGVPRAESVARVPHHRAPEGTATAEADLFGLGVTLYRAVTGAWPTGARTPGALAGPPPPASAHGVDPAADALLAGLLSPDPSARAAAVAGLPSAPVTLPESALVPAIPGASAVGAAPAPLAAGASTPIRTTAPAPPTLPSTTQAMLPWAVLVPLRNLSPGAVRVIASRAAVDPEAVRRAAAKGATWCVDTAQSEAEANRILKRLEVAGVKGGHIRVTTAPRVIQYLLLAVVSVVVGLVAGATLLLPFAGLAAVLVYMAVVNLKGMFAVADTRMKVQESARAMLPDTAPEARLRALRRRVAAAELPEIVLADLRSEVAHLEERLDGVRAHEAELAAAGGGAELRARRGKLDVELASVEADLARFEGALTLALTEDLAEAPVRKRIEAAPPTTDTSSTTTDTPPLNTDAIGVPTLTEARPRSLDVVSEDEDTSEGDGPPRPRQTTKA